jgi:hypothetical protein
MKVGAVEASVKSADCEGGILGSAVMVAFCPCRTDHEQRYA